MLRICEVNMKPTTDKTLSTLKGELGFLDSGAYRVSIANGSRCLPWRPRLRGGSRFSSKILQVARRNGIAPAIQKVIAYF